MKRSIHRLITALSILFIAGIILSYLSVWISPEKLWLLSIFGLFYPYFLIANLGLLIYWTFRNRKTALLILVVILSGTIHIRNHYQFRGTKGNDDIVLSRDRQENRKTVKILTFNVKLFNFYEANRGSGSYNDFRKLILEQEADIICLQEVLVPGNNGLSLETLSRDLGRNPYSYYKFIGNPSKTRNYGNIIFSAYPIINKGEVSFSKTGSRCIYVDMVISGDTVRVYNNHLQSFRLGSKNLALITDFEHNLNEKSIYKLQEISLRMKTAYIQRAKQAKQLKLHINNSKYPVIVCGDFNDTPVSFVYRTIKTGLTDSFVEAGKGFGKTYEQIFPSFRIDYILHSKNIHTNCFRTVKTRLSDHYPLVSTLELQSSQSPGKH